MLVWQDAAWQPPGTALVPALGSWAVPVELLWLSAQYWRLELQPAYLQGDGDGDGANWPAATPRIPVAAGLPKLPLPFVGQQVP